MPSRLDRTSLVNTEFITWKKTPILLRDTAGSPEPGQDGIIFPAHKESHIKKRVIQNENISHTLAVVCIVNFDLFSRVNECFGNYLLKKIIPNTFRQ